MNNKIQIHTTTGVLFLKPEDILYYKAVENYTELFVKNRKTYLLYETLNEIEKNPPIDTLFRIHRSYIINILQLCEYRSKRHEVILEEDYCLPIAQSRIKAFETIAIDCYSCVV